MTSKARETTIQRREKYSTYYKQDYHTEDECHDKYLNRKEA